MKINSKLLLSLFIEIRLCPLVTENLEHKNIYIFYKYVRDILVFQNWFTTPEAPNLLNISKIGIITLI